MDEYWFCLKHHTVEPREGCKNADRLGPYPSAEAASHALEKVEQNNEKWDEEDREWNEGPGPTESGHDG
ncbi:hypothetical protein [Nocardioides sp. Kera G14]|uniref:hypothetical protein n=1 Tax=Nocardioides sp. Kera G14 TaxID=2884264 RepID=UPI001D119BB3|nr:hypothetical protein [Nocardioides sp. Kera G14]UDY24911.1 hypothetical protein LH076_06365 [Nocardioides sp. Kera G14]